MSTDRPSRQQRRKQLRALLTEGRAAIAHGLPNPAPQSTLIGAGLVIAEPLGTAGPARASDAAGLAIRLATGMIDTVAAREAPACRKGCDHCCHFAISASAPEVFHLARALRSGGAATAGILARIAARHHDTAGMPLAALMATSLPCPMLADGACGAYTARPIVCRQFMSRSALACQSARAGETVAIPTLRGAINAGVLARSLLLAAARTHGLDERCYEVASALAAALITPDSERRWLAGENVLAAALVVPRPPEANAMVERLAGEMRAVLPQQLDGRRDPP